MNKSMAYATGTKSAMRSTGDKPPLEKSTIKKAHKIAKAMLRKEDYNSEDFQEFVTERYDGLSEEDLALIETMYESLEGEEAEEFLDLLDQGELDAFLDELEKELED